VISASSTEARFFFFLAAVFDLASSVDRSLSSTSVVCDRYVFSTLAYHSALGLDIEAAACHLQLLLPDYAFFLDAPETSVRLSRIHARGSSTPADEEFAHSAKESAARQVYRRFGLIAVDVSHLGIDEVVEVLVRAIGPSRWPNTTLQRRYGSTYSLGRSW
jgi:thymidylate kinase